MCSVIAFLIPEEETVYSARFRVRSLQSAAIPDRNTMRSLTQYTAAEYRRIIRPNLECRISPRRHNARGCLQPDCRLPTIIEQSYKETPKRELISGNPLAVTREPKPRGEVDVYMYISPSRECRFIAIKYTAATLNCAESLDAIIYVVLLFRITRSNNHTYSICSDVMGRRPGGGQ